MERFWQVWRENKDKDQTQDFKDQCNTNNKLLEFIETSPYKESAYEILGPNINFTVKPYYLLKTLLQAVNYKLFDKKFNYYKQQIYFNHIKYYLIEK